MFHSVIIASTGRPRVLAGTIEALQRQQRLPDECFVSIVDEGDMDDIAPPGFPVTIIFGEKGLTRQRNRAIDRLDPRSEIVSFLDDDMELDPAYFEGVQSAFAALPDVVGLDGDIVADGGGRGGIEREEALRLLRRPYAPSQEFVEASGLYGCNMNVRRSVLEHVRFDEALPAYGLYEDLDFSRRCRAFGRIGRYMGCRMVHLGEHSARLPGLRMGFSQLMNPAYLYRKGTLSTRELLFALGLRSLAANMVGSIVPVRHGLIDYRGRLKGNLIALGHLLRGRTDPAGMHRL